MVTVRFARFGTHKRPYYHVVVTDSQKPRDGKFIELIGKYDPSKPMADATLDLERLAYWRGVGAQVSESCDKLIRAKKAAPAN